MGIIYQCSINAFNAFNTLDPSTYRCYGVYYACIIK